ncbi:MAG: C25 family cysteine peptidase [Blastocatellia bacterium]
MSPRRLWTITHFSGVLAPGCFRLHRFVSGVGVTAFAKRSRTLIALMAIGVLLAIHAAAPHAFGDCPCVGGTQVVCGNQIISNGATVASRIQLDAVGGTSCPTVASCGTPLAGTFRFLKYTFTNNTSGASPDCFTVTFSSACDTGAGGGDAICSAAYLGSFDPTNVCTNYIADMGLSTATAPGDTYSFSLANGATAVVVVFSRTTNAPCTLPFTITITPCPLSPTAATMESFTATAYDRGTVLEWRTGLEIGNLGFNIYREDGLRRTRLNSQVLAGSALLAGPTLNLKSGRSYSWADTGPADKNARYWIEDIDLNGRSSWHGPVSIDRSKPIRQLPPPERARISALSKLGTDGSQPSQSAPLARAAKPAEVTATALATQAGLAAQPAVKMAVKQEGWYRVTQSELAAAGFDTRTHPAMLQLFVDGKEQSFRVVGQADGRLDAIEFYGLGSDSASTSARTYWLVAGSQPGQRISEVIGKGKRDAPGSFPYTVERRDRSIYFSSLRNGARENFFGGVIASEPVDQSLDVQHLDRTSNAASTLDVSLQGVTETSHHVRVDVNGKSAGELKFEGQAEGLATMKLQQGSLKEGSNIVTLTPLGGDGDTSLVGYVRITYPHTYTADGNSLRFNAAAKQRVDVDGFTSSAIRVMDVTDPDAVTELSAKVRAKNGGYAVTVNTPKKGGTRLLWAFAEDRVSRPDAIALDRPSNLREPGAGADLVIISHPDFINSVEPLKALRESQGFKVAVVNVEDVYDEFNFGQKSPQAIKDFLAFARSSWETAPRFVLLVGDASLDPKGYLGRPDSDFVPTKLIDTSLMETASDDWLADFEGDGATDMAVGRLPVGTVEETTSMIAKIIGYDRSMPSNHVLLVADSVDVNDDFDFESFSHDLRSAIPQNLIVGEIDRGQMNPALAQTELLANLYRGQKVVNYIGHGNIDQWRGDLLTSADARGLENSAHLPLFVSMTCLNGYFQDGGLESLAESLLKAERGGAIAVWASSGMTGAFSQAVMNQEMFRLVLDGSMTLGEATLKAKATVVDSDFRRTWILFGDPTTRLR